MILPRFNTVFTFLLLISGSCAFILPRERTGAVRGWGEAVLAPVASPVRAMGAAVRGRIGGPGESRAGAESAEVQRLRAEVARLTTQNQELQRLVASRELMGDAHRYSVPVRVIGLDSGGKQNLLLDGGRADGLSEGMAVVWRDSLIGRIDHVQEHSARVKLVTDRTFRVSAVFGRFVAGEAGSAAFLPLQSNVPLVEGGGDALAVVGLTMQELKQAGVAAGHWVVLADADWPPVVQGFLLGQVEKIEPQSENMLYGRVEIRPRLDARQLREVMVIVGERRGW